VWASREPRKSRGASATKKRSSRAGLAATGSYALTVPNTFNRREPYAPRTQCYSGLLTREQWRLRRHDITPMDSRAGLSDALYAQGEALALSLLPYPAITTDRPGVGFLIRHSGINQHYIILAWWDNQNELLTRVLVRSSSPDGNWVDAQGQYSFCVWDLEVFARERDRYVQCVLTPAAGPEIDRYVAD